MIVVVLTAVVFTFTPYLYAGDSPLPINPNPEGGEINFLPCTFSFTNYGIYTLFRECKGDMGPAYSCAYKMYRPQGPTGYCFEF